MRRTLSTNDTFALKYCFPAFNALLFIIAEGFLCWWSLKDKSWMIIAAICLLPIIGVVSTIYGVKNGRRYKRVQADDSALYISVYKAEVRVPFSDIENASVDWKLQGKAAAIPIVTIVFRNPIIFGKQVEFIGTQPWNTSHSIVAELREWRDGNKPINVGP